MIIKPSRFRKASFSKSFLSSLKRKASVVKFLRFQERFRKAPFSRRISISIPPSVAHNNAGNNPIPHGKSSS